MVLQEKPRSAKMSFSNAFTSVKTTIWGGEYNLFLFFCFFKRQIRTVSIEKIIKITSFKNIMNNMILHKYPDL